MNPVATIEEFPLEDGGVTLAMPSRERRDLSPTGRRRERARIITFAWGERYVTDLLRLALPALLAPGNIPAFVESFETELVVVTETRFFPLISCAPAIVAALRHVDVRLVPIDDLLSPWYGITLTHALMRGFTDLGAAMTETHLVFLNADFIVADGSYRRLAETILRGERVVAAPSYCAVLETLVPELTARLDRSGMCLAVGARDLASLVIAHRHSTVRAKTINGSGLSTHRYDQFYWVVDESTLLARQLPIAVVYLRPTRCVAQLPTFWDYGVVSELCPGTKPHVLGDSDDFLMGELRARGTFREVMGAQQPTIDAIARDLSGFTTQDQRDQGRHTLVLHKGPLPACFNAERRKFESFVDSVYRALGPALPHRDHPFWKLAAREFAVAHARAVARFAAQRAARQEVLRSEEGQALQRDIRTLSVHLRDLEMAGADEALQRQARHRLTNCVESLDRAVTRQVTANPGGSSRDAVCPPSPLPWSLRLYRRAFGEMPEPSAWHPLNATVRAVVAALRNSRRGDALVISSGGLLAAPLTRLFTGRVLSLSPGMAVARLYQDSLVAPHAFDACLLDLAAEDLDAIPEILASVRCSLAPNAAVVLFHQGDAVSARHAVSCIAAARPEGPQRVVFTGSRPGAIAARLFLKAMSRYDLGTWPRRIAFALTLALSAPLARVATWIEERRDGSLPRGCTSVTVELTIN
ncbi:MAG: hypothetical protein ACM30I_05210 [Gemmatimonas sp.]